MWLNCWHACATTGCRRSGSSPRCGRAGAGRTGPHLCLQRTQKRCGAPGRRPSARSFVGTHHCRPASLRERQEALESEAAPFLFRECSALFSSWSSRSSIRAGKPFRVCWSFLFLFPYPSLGTCAMDGTISASRWRCQSAGSDRGSTADEFERNPLGAHRLAFAVVRAAAKALVSHGGAMLSVLSSRCG